MKKLINDVETVLAELGVTFDEGKTVVEVWNKIDLVPEDEREAVIRFNVPRLLDRGFLDEAGLRAALDRMNNQRS